MSLYGGMSKGERNRIKTRVRTAMAAQAAIEGRFLGGRPPYGYVLADAGPHPNPGKAALGQRLHVLELDMAAAPVVRRIFTDYLAGTGHCPIMAHLEPGRGPLERREAVSDREIITKRCCPIEKRDEISHLRRVVHVP